MRKAHVSFSSVALLAMVPAWSAGSIIDGMNASVPCQACHGADGVSISDDIPNLAGQKIAYLKAQLSAFKSGDRKHDVMNPIAKQLSDADVENLAAYWSGLPVGGPHKEAVAGALAARRPAMTFPSDFPGAFVNYYTQEDAASKSVTRFHANAVAVEAARAGKPLPDGSIIMVEGSRAKLDANDKAVLDSSGHMIAAATTYYSGMEVRAGWGQEIPRSCATAIGATRSSTRRRSAPRRTTMRCALAATRA